MRCRQASQLISSHVDGELPSDQERVLRRHLEACPRCAGEVVALIDLRRRLRAFDAAENRVAPSRSFRRRVMAAVTADRGAPALPGSKRSGLRLLKGAHARRILLAAGSLAAAVLLLVTGLMLGAEPTDRPAPEADALVARDSILAADDVQGRLDLARQFELRGDPRGARGQYLRVLAVDPANAIARGALGHAGPAPAPSVLRTPDRDFPARVRAIPTDVRHPLLARGPVETESELAMTRIEYEGHALDRGAVRDFVDLLDRDERLADDLARRRASLARGPDSIVRPTSALKGTPRAIAAYVSQLEPIQPEEPNRYDDLVILPVYDRSGRGSGPRVVVAATALTSGRLSITEEKPGRVVARNRGKDAAVFIPAGTIIAGNSQDRVTRRDVLVKAGQSTPLNTFCCQQGRQAIAAKFTSIPGVAGPGLRRLILRERDQDLIWSRIRNQTDRLDAETRTHALRAVYERTRMRRLLDLGRKRLLPLLADPRVVGFVAADGGRILGADVFGSHDLFERLAAGYLESYLVDALSDEVPEGEEDLTVVRARTFLLSVMDTHGRESRGASLGREAHFNASGLYAYGLALQGRTIHVSLFPVKGGGPANAATRKADPAPSSADEGAGRTPEASGESRKHDPSEAGRRIEGRREGVRRGAPAKPRPIKPPPTPKRPEPTPGKDLPSRTPKSDLR